MLARDILSFVAPVLAASASPVALMSAANALVLCINLFLIRSLAFGEGVE
jgi:hypothetical protein